MEKLTDREVDVMMAVWNYESEQVPTGYILKHINRSKRNSLQTLQVVLRRLCEKGCLRCDKGRQTNLYTALLQKDAYLEFTGKIFLAHHYPHNPLKFILQTLSENRGLLTAADVKRLQNIIDESGLKNDCMDEPDAARKDS